MNSSSSKQPASAQVSNAHDPVLVIAVSSRTLFDLSYEHDIYLKDGVDEYRKHQLAHETEVLNSGIAFSLVKKLLAIKHPETNLPLVEVILVSRNNGDTGLRIFNSIQHYNLNIQRAAFSNGKSPYAYLKAFGAHLFLSAHNQDVELALKAGYASAHLLTRNLEKNLTSGDNNQVRIAFDGDAVLFSDDSEKIYKQEGLAAFKDNEQKKAGIPLTGGPFKPFLLALHNLQSLFKVDETPIRTALVTARSAPSHKRVILTLREWGIRIDEALFVGGLDKAEFLKAFKADIFFDDQLIYIQSASNNRLTSGHVPYGVANANNTTSSSENSDHFARFTCKRKNN
ncbi:5'-nucleotidase [hydrothermal vent metagenome]|uniref:5'-nucleotidase n=1 Tax=hydrothermal vent metagenome TaxID=652676 RepID=A0A3B0UZS0_9ZZZZ